MFIGTAINDEVSNLIIAQMLFLQSEDAEKDISSISIRRAGR